MKYRTKLFLSFLAVSFLNTIVALWIIYKQSDSLLFNGIRSKVTSIAATAALGIDGDALEKFQNDPAKYPEIHQSISIYLAKVRDANRRPDIHAHFVYILFLSRTDPQELLYSIDAAEDSPVMTEMSQFGEKFNDPDGLLQHLDRPFSPNHFTKDRWGTWLSGFAPIYNSEGDTVAYVAIDLRGERVRDVLNELIGYAVMALLISLCLAFIFAYILSKIVTSSLQTICLSVVEIGNGNLASRTDLQSHDEFGDLSSAINAMAQGLQERERLKTGFARYVSQYVLEKILKSGNAARFEGERRKITVIFTDIRHFTAIAEHLPPEEVVHILNEYFEAMIDVIFRYHGTLDKFLGDGLMIEFGAPLDDENQEKHALLAAIEMQQALKKLNVKWVGEGKEPLKIGIGINTGLAVVGNIGSEKRVEYTAIGDTVNVASRLEQATKQLDVQILISKSTFQAVEGVIKGIPTGSLEIHGRHDHVEAFSIDPEQDITPITSNLGLLIIPKKET